MSTCVYTYSLTMECTAKNFVVFFYDVIVWKQDKCACAIAEKVGVTAVRTRKDG